MATGWVLPLSHVTPPTHHSSCNISLPFYAEDFMLHHVTPTPWGACCNCNQVGMLQMQQKGSCSRTPFPQTPAHHASNSITLCFCSESLALCNSTCWGACCGCNQASTLDRQHGGPCKLLLSAQTCHASHNISLSRHLVNDPATSNITFLAACCNLQSQWACLSLRTPSVLRGALLWV